MKTATTAMVTFRGEPVEVVYEDMGAEPDCNAHVIEWSFSNDAQNCLRLTEAEEQSIYDQLKDQIESAPSPAPEE